MTIPPRCLPTAPKTCLAALLTAVSLLAGPAVYGQGYSDNFDSYSGQTSLSGRGPWDTNDPYNGGNVGQSDYVGQVAGYTPGYDPVANTGGTDYWAYVGGGQRGTGLVPGSPTVYDFATFSLSSAATYSYSFNVDMSIASSVSNFTTRDSFAWTFLGLSSGTSVGSPIFSLNFTPDAATYIPKGTNGTSSLMNVSYTTYRAAGTVLQQSANLKGISYDSIYHLTINVTVTAGGTAGTASFTLTPSTGGGPAVTLASGVPLVNPGNVREAAATWNLTNTAGDSTNGFTNGGGNELLFNNYALTVPEPSIWAMLGAGVTALGVWGRRRVRA